MLGFISGCYTLVRDVHELKKILATYAPSRQNGAGLTRAGTSQVLQCYYTLYIYRYAIFLYRNTAAELC
jgi:hypothetical protein